MNNLSPQKIRRKRKIARALKVVLFLVIVLILIGTSLSYKIIFSTQDNENSPGFFDSFGQLPVIKTFGRLLGAGNKQLAGEKEDRINVLLLGMGGANHPGPLLTDTIMLATIQPSTGQVALLSIPRDLVVPTNGSYSKINSLNGIGELNNFPGGGSAYVARIASEVFGQTIHYYVRVDFSGFEQLIDELGGVDVFVETAFEDPFFPDEALVGYAPISFKAGWQHMSGDRALKYARSRHGEAGGGFARTARQQQIILAVKEKALNWTTLINPNRIYNLIKTLGDHIQTNIATWEITRFVDLTKDITDENIHSVVLSDAPDSFLTSRINESGAYTLIPRRGDYQSLQELAENIFTPPAFEPELATLGLQNGTLVAGLATQNSDRLENLGYHVSFISNALDQKYEKTVIYDFTGGQKPESLAFLKALLEANVSANLPQSIVDSIPLSITLDNLDFLIILGKNAVE
jgi:polyisoprenyl-teichoic acid--peptidoglycan teichoic acid transferase